MFNGNTDCPLCGMFPEGLCCSVCGQKLLDDAMKGDLGKALKNITPNSADKPFILPDLQKNKKTKPT